MPLPNEDDGKCSICRVYCPERLTPSVITDESGGCFISICDNCIRGLRTPRCAVCGAMKKGWHKAERIYVDRGDLKEVNQSICDTCRSEIGFTNTPEHEGIRNISEGELSRRNTPERDAIEEREGDG